MALSNQIAKMLIDKARIARIPLTVNFELLPVCNLKCKMCYIQTDWDKVEKKGGLISVEQWLKLAQEMKNAGTFFLLLTGGEVFLYPRFQELYIALYQMGFSIALNTNATMIDEKVVSWLKKYPPRCVSISLYGASDETYERLCGRKAIFSKVDKAINLLKDNGITIEAKTILTQLNYKDLNALNKYTKEKKIPYEVSSYAFPATRKQQCEKMDVRFSAEEAACCMVYINETMYDKDSCRKAAQEYIDNYEKSKDVAGREHYGLTCSGANTSCWITWEGKMTPCAMFNEPYTQPYVEGFQVAWDHLKEKTDAICMSSACAHCEKRQVCTVCPASAYAETGNISGVSEYHCKMTSKTIELMYEQVCQK